jgi:hypothetical protein
LVRARRQVARLDAYVRRRRLGFNFSTQPPLTQTLGPWLRPSSAKKCESSFQQKDLLEALIGQFTPLRPVFSQNWHHSQTNWLPFYWKGFSKQPGIHYVLADLGDEELLWKGLNQNIRTTFERPQSDFHCACAMTLVWLRSWI